MNIRVIKFAVMIKIILLPLQFILYFLISAVVFCLFALIFNWGIWFSPSLEPLSGLLIYLPAAAGNIIFPSVSAALLFSLFGVRRRSLPPLAVVIISVCVFLILFSAPKLTAALESRYQQRNFQPFLQQTIHITEDGLIYTDSVGDADSGELGGIIIRNRDAEIPGLRYYETARVNGTGGRVVLEIDPDSSMNIMPANPVFNAEFQPPEIFGYYLKDIGFFNRTLTAAAQQGGFDYLYLTLVFSAFLMICFLYRGISTWPLFEMTFILFLHRIVLYVFRLFSDESGFISETFFGGRFAGSIPLFTLIALSAVLLIAGLLLKTAAGSAGKA